MLIRPRLAADCPAKGDTTPSEGGQSREATDDASGRPMYAKVAAKHIQPDVETAPADRSGTGTPIFAKIAAEVADSAELLHEEVPEREKPADVGGRTPVPVSEDTTAAEVADTSSTLDSDAVCIPLSHARGVEGRLTIARALSSYWNLLRVDIAPSSSSTTTLTTIRIDILPTRRPFLRTNVPVSTCRKT